MGAPRIEVLLDPNGKLARGAWRIAIRRAPAGVDPEDLVADALVRAWRDWPRYDAAKGASPSTFVWNSLQNGIKDAVRVYRGVSRRAVELLASGAEVPAPGERRTPALTSVDLRQAVAVAHAASLSPVSYDEKGLSIDVPCEHRPFRDAADRDETLRLLMRLERKERMIMMLYYFEDLTMREIGHVLFLSESRVCQLHSRALERLRGGA